MKTGYGLLCALLVVLAGGALAVESDQIDDFEDGTVQNWMVAALGQPHPFPPVNEPSGGPEGGDDSYLRLTAIGGDGPGSRLAVMNAVQWAGDYTAAGVDGIALDVINLGTTDLHLRLLFEDPTTAPPTNVATTEAYVLPAGSGWQSIAFGVDPASLIPLLGSVDALLANTTVIRIFHNPEASFPPPPVAAQLGVDNVAALAAVANEAATWSGVKATFE